MIEDILDWATDHKPLAVEIGLVLLIGLSWGGYAVAHSILRHHATTGTVLDKRFEKEHIIYMPVTTCSGKVCTTTQVPTVIPDHWYLRLQDDTGTQDDARVSEGLYGTCVIGQYYEEGVCS